MKGRKGLRGWWYLIFVVCIKHGAGVFQDPVEYTHKHKYIHTYIHSALVNPREPCLLVYIRETRRGEKGDAKTTHNS